MSYNNLLKKDQLSVLGKEWRARTFNEREAIAINQKINKNPLLGKILSSRNIYINDVKNFIDPSLKNLLPNPSIFLDMDKSVDRIYDAIINNENIVFYSDYDVDGVTSSTILMRFFKIIGKPAEAFFPSRHKEGYGLNSQAVADIKKNLHADLLVALDNGTTAFDGVNTANSLGMDTIIIDHHKQMLDLPDCYSIVNPKRNDESGDYHHLCTAGLAFILVVALNRKLRESGYYQTDSDTNSDSSSHALIKEPKARMMQLLDLVALGTVCDVVPLVGINRAFVKAGLKQIHKRTNMGIKTLFDLAKSQSPATSSDLGFKIGPRINAVGRLGSAKVAFDLLYTDMDYEAEKLSMELNTVNKRRQEIEQDIYLQAKKQCEQILKDDTTDHKAFIVSGYNWNSGVIGIIAGRIKERFHIPSLAISYNENHMGVGSARSIKGVDMGAIIIKAVEKNILIRGGGHPMAGGFSLEKAKESEFLDFLNENISHQTEEIQELVKPHILTDGLLNLETATKDLCRDLEYLAPYGEGNPETVFVFPDVVVYNAKLTDSRVNFFVKTRAGTTLKAVAFKCGSNPLGDLLLSQSNKPISLLGNISLNKWNGSESIQLRIFDGINNNLTTNK